MRLFRNSKHPKPQEPEPQRRYAERHWRKLPPAYMKEYMTSADTQSQSSYWYTYPNGTPFDYNGPRGPQQQDRVDRVAYNHHAQHANGNYPNRNGHGPSNGHVPRDMRDHFIDPYDPPPTHIPKDRPFTVRKDRTYHRGLDEMVSL